MLGTGLRVRIPPTHLVHGFAAASARAPRPSLALAFAHRLVVSRSSALFAIRSWRLSALFAMIFALRDSIVDLGSSIFVLCCLIFLRSCSWRRRLGKTRVQATTMWQYDGSPPAPTGFSHRRYRSCSCRHGPASLLLTFAQELEMHRATLAIVLLRRQRAPTWPAEVAYDSERGWGDAPARRPSDSPPA